MRVLLPRSLFSFAVAWTATVRPVVPLCAGLAVLLASRVAGAAEPGTALTVRLEFDVKTDQLAEVVARAQARLDAFGAKKARAVQRSGRLVVELPSSEVPKRSEIESLISRPHLLAFTIVENDSPLMIDLIGRLEQDPRSHELGIFRDIGGWQPTSTRGYESDPFLEGQREALERYLGGLAVAQQPDRDHAFLLAPVPDRPKLWRTAYVDLRTQVRIARALEARVDRLELGGQTETEIVFLLLPADGDRLRALTRAHLGKKMAITVDGEVLSIPIIEGVIGDKNRMMMSDEPLARRLAAALLGGPMLAPVTVRARRSQPH
jgi:preprotein translocase subunit SecD